MKQRAQAADASIIPILVAAHAANGRVVATMAAHIHAANGTDAVVSLQRHSHSIAPGEALFWGQRPAYWMIINAQNALPPQHT